MKGSGTSPSTLIQLSAASLPPIDPSFYQNINQIVDTNVPVPANEMVPMSRGQLGGGYYYNKYMKYKKKYIHLKNELLFINR